MATTDRWVIVRSAALADLIDGVERALPVILDSMLADHLRGSLAELKTSLIPEPV